MTKSRIEGKVVGFILHIDPENKRGLSERLEFQSLDDVADRCKEIRMENEARRDKEPDLTIYTVCQLADGTTEEQEGYDFRYKIGSYICKVFCSGYPDHCENTVGWFPPHSSTNKHLCSNCRHRQESDDDIDVDGVNDRLGREDEY